MTQFAHLPLGLTGLIALACLLQLLATRFLPEGRQLMRMHLGLAGLGVVLMLIGRVIPPLSLGLVKNVLDEVVILGWGVLFLRIVLISIFRLLLPVLRMLWPRILEDLLFILGSLIWVLIRLRMVGLDLSGLLTTSAVMTAILAFAMKETLGNVLGGMALQLDNSFEIGDWISLGAYRGQVIEIHWRHTALLTTDGEKVVLPNSELVRSTVMVFSSAQFPNFRRAVSFSTSNTVAPSQVVAAVEGAICGSVIDNVASKPLPHCILTDYRDGLTWYAVRYWLTDPQSDAIADSLIRKHIFTALRRHNIALGKPNLNARMQNDNSESVAVKKEQEIAHRMQMLSVVKLFEGFHEDELRQIATGLTVTPFTKGEVITRQGTMAHWLYLLVTGEVEVWYEVIGHKRQFVARLGAGEVFGEMGMMTGEPCRSTITANSNLECYRIDKLAFEAILRERPALADVLAQIMSERDSDLAAAEQGFRGSGQNVSQANLLRRIKKFFGLPG
jgi:small-conductance mechanosensitive channel/CRP-like cAMP-binding protein